MTQNLIILGASGRAAAMSARMAGYTPFCADMFADADLQEIATAIRVDRYPNDLRSAQRLFPPGEWIYTGGLENYPKLVEQIARERPLIGNNRSVLQQVRNPFELTSVLSRCGFAVPQTQIEVPTDYSRRWLRKPMRSAGGTNIAFWADNKAIGRSPDDSETEDATRALYRHHYFQEHIAGTSYGAVCAVNEQQGAMLLGVTQSLTGEEWSGASGFVYCGSVGPVTLPEAAERTVRKSAKVIAQEFSLQGLFGIDFVLSEGHPYVVEVNPRYTAAVEVLEKAYCRPLLTWYIDSTHFASQSPVDSTDCLSASCCVGKSILYARQPWKLTERQSRCFETIDCVEYRDIPVVGTSFEAGQPIVTIMVEGDDRTEVMERLKAVSVRTEACLFAEPCQS